MSIVIPLGVILLGLAAGSFLNAVVFRLGTAESVIWGRSHCMSCKHVLEWHELVPVASFVMLGGHCRSCHAPISFQYPVVEVLTAAAFILLWQNYQNVLFINSPFAAATAFLGDFAYVAGLIFYLVVAFLLLAVALYDYRTLIVAPTFMLPLFIFSIINLALQWLGDVSIWAIVPAVSAAAAVFLVFAALWFFSRGRAMGFGDAELAPVIILLLGPALGLAALLFAFWAGAIVGVFLILLGRAGLKSEIPFGPFLSAGALASLFWGNMVIQSYFSFLLL